MSIQLKGVKKSYSKGAPVLDGVDLEVGEGEIYALLGANGAGKTTTLHILLGFVNADAGVASVCGFDVAHNAAKVREQVAYIPEQVSLYPRLTGVENLDYILSLGGCKKSDPELRHDLEQAGLAQAAMDRRAGTYSKGMRQKVGLAVALARGAKVFLLDEPLSGLDPQAARDFCDRLRTLTENGCCALMATHDLFRAREIGSRIGIMAGGRIARELEPFEVTGADLERIYLEYIGELA